MDRPPGAQQQHRHAAEEAVPAPGLEPLARPALVARRRDQVHRREAAQIHEHVQVHVERGQRHQAKTRNEISTMRYSTAAPESPITKKRA